MAGTVYPGSKFSIHSILGESNAGMAAPNGALHPGPATLVSMQEAALRAAYCTPYSMTSPCPPVPSSAAPPAFHPTTHQFNSTAAVLRTPAQQTPMTWQPLTFYQDPRTWHLTSNTDSIATYPQAGCVSCYSYDTPSVPLTSGHPRTPFSFGALKLKRKKTRTVFTRSQIDKLEMTFNGKRYLSSNDRVQLALALKMTETQVKVWFQNRRNKWKREMANKSPSGSRQENASHDSGRSSTSPERSEDESDVDVASDLGSDESEEMTNSSRAVSNTSTSPAPYVPFAVMCR